MAVADQRHSINLTPGLFAPVIVHCSLGDKGQTIRFDVYNGSEPVDMTGAAVTVHGVRADSGNWGPLNCSANGHTVAFNLTTAITSAEGGGLAEISVSKGSAFVGSANFAIMVERATWADGVTYSNDVSVYENILAYVKTFPAQMAAGDATLQANINAEASARATADTGLQAQIDQIVAPSGEAPSAAEVQNARIGADNVTYPTLGDAIRTQNVNLKSAIKRISENTKNLWKIGDVSINATPGFVSFLLEEPLSPGTYTLSCIHTSQWTGGTYGGIRFSRSRDINHMSGDDYVANLKISHTGSRVHTTFTLSETAYTVRLMSADSQANSNGRSATYTMIQVEKGSDVTYYELPVTAKDLFALRTLDTFITSDNVSKYPSADNLPPNSIIGVQGTAGMINYPPTTATCEIITFGHFLNRTTLQIAMPLNNTIDENIYVRGNPSGDEYMGWLTVNRDLFAVRAMNTFVTSENVSKYPDANDLPPNSIIGVQGSAGMLNYPPTKATCEIITLGHLKGRKAMQIAMPLNNVIDKKIYMRGNPSGNEYLEWVSEEGIFESDDVTVFSDFSAGYIDTSSAVVSTTPVIEERWSHKIIGCEEGETYLMGSCGGGAQRLQWVVCDDNYNIIARSTTMSETNSGIIAYNPWAYPVNIPASGKYLVINHHHLDNNSYVSPRFYRISKDDMKNYFAVYQDGTLPYKYKESWKRYVVATYDSMIVTLRSNKFSLSRDCGKTWNSGVDVSAVSGIQRAYLFSNGNLAFYTDTKAYYIDDWKSYHEADCYEQNGSQFVPSPSTNFFNYWIHKERKFVNGRDMYVFGTYKLVPGERVLIWYTLDYGKTYKVAYEFNIEGSYSIRHVHEVLYYEPEDKFIVTTGDSNATECMVFLFEYDVENDTWTHTLVGGPARNYKWANMAIWNDEIYYCNDNTPGSVWKFKFEDIGDLSKHTCVLENTYCDPFSVNFGNMGDMLVTQSHVRNTAGIDVPIPFDPHCAARVMYYSSNRKDFNEVVMPIQMIKGETYLSNFLPVTSDGHLFCGIFAGQTKLPSVCVDEFIRLAGYKQAFKPKF